MPRYNFRCPKCHRELEIVKSINDETVPLCCGEDCGPIEMVQVFSPTAFILKGGGWAKDGYK